MEIDICLVFGAWNLLIMPHIDLVFIDYTRAKPRLMGRVLASRIVRTALPHMKLSGAGNLEVAVVMVGTERMRKMNRKWRKVNKPTDVLAFPLPGPRPKGYTSILLGDVFICPMIVRKKAAREGLSEHAQMRWSLVHGLLHLAGYDHERSAVAAEKMAEMEQRILNKLK